MSDLAHELARELLSEKCPCGRRKQSRKTFCSTCYHSLPTTIKYALYLRIGEGYEEAYASAAKHLDCVKKLTEPQQPTLFPREGNHP